MLKELIIKLAREKKIKLDIEESAEINHVAVDMTSSVPSSTQLYDQRKNLIQFGTFEPIVVQFQQRIVTKMSQNRENSVEDDDEGRIVVTRRKGKQSNSIQKESSFCQKHAKGNISHKKKGKRNKKDEDFFRSFLSITLREFLPRIFLDVHPKEVL